MGPAVALAVAAFSAATSQPLAYANVDGTLFLGRTDALSPATVYSGPDTVTPLSLSPDGTTVLVLDENPDRTQLALVKAGSAPAPVDGTTDADGGSFSPDGKSIVFTIGPGQSETLAGGIYVVAVRGGTPKQVVETPDGASDSLPALSPDGRAVVFVREAEDADGSLVGTVSRVAAGGGDVAPLAGHASTNVFAGGRISFSPDGSSVAYAGDADATGIFVVPLAGGTARRLTTDFDNWPSFTADGSAIVFARDATSSGSDGNSDSPKKPVDDDLEELWTINADGSGAAVVDEGDFEDLATAPYAVAVPPPPSGGKAGVGATAVRVVVKGNRYTVTWQGTASTWRVTLRVGKKTVSATVPGAVHSHVFVVRGAKGKPKATVAGA